MDKDKILHIIISLALRAAEWMFDTYGEVAEHKIAALVEKRYGFDATPFLEEFRIAIKEYEETHPIPSA